MRKHLKSIYLTRYKAEDEEKKRAIWQVMCHDFLQRFVGLKDTVIDVAAGHCEFINNIQAGRKVALDLDDRINQYAGKDVETIIADCTKMPAGLSNTFDVVFMGCLLEHLPSKNAIINLFQEVKKILKKNGRIIILNPNIRFSTSDYWDYFDHLTPVSDRSIVEILKALGYRIELCLPRFVPNTIKDRLPKSVFLVKLYLKMPFLFPIFGKQMFIVAKKKRV